MGSASDTANVSATVQIEALTLLHKKRQSNVFAECYSLVKWTLTATDKKIPQPILTASQFD